MVTGITAGDVKARRDAWAVSGDCEHACDPRGALLVSRHALAGTGGGPL
jgi:hypothetical protein